MNDCDDVRGSETNTIATKVQKVELSPGILLPESTYEPRKHRYFYSVRTERTHCAYAMSSFSGENYPPAQLGLGLKQGWELPSTPDPQSI